ncbi:MAG: HigA family addiction module antitoxin [Pseudomonadota bacterium]
MTMHNPPHPGEFIRETYIQPFDISVRSLADSLDVAPSTLARIVAERSGISPEMALRLSKALGRSPESWLAMQHNFDLWQARKSANLSGIRKIQFEATA